MLSITIQIKVKKVIVFCWYSYSGQLKVQKIRETQKVLIEPEDKKSFCLID